MRNEAAEIGGSRIRIGYRLDLHYEVSGPADFIFNIHAARSARQRVLSEAVIVDPPLAWRVDTEPTLGNRLLRLHADVGALDVRYLATVEVAHYMAEPAHVVAASIDALPADVLLFLWPSRYCQGDQVQQLAWREFGHMTPGFAQVDAVCRWVRSRVALRGGTSTIRTSALTTLAHGVAVCR